MAGQHGEGLAVGMVIAVRGELNGKVCTAQASHSDLPAPILAKGHYAAFALFDVHGACSAIQECVLLVVEKISWHMVKKISRRRAPGANPGTVWVTL